MSLEQYAQQRTVFRAGVIEHKRNRLVGIGPSASWCFEDRRTIRYQVQEMLRVERIFEVDGIQQELDAYNPLIPDGSNWKVTFLLEFPDVEERRVRLSQLRGIEDRCWVQVAGHDRVWAIADEDLERENDAKTSAVHFLRFELTPGMRAQIHTGATVGVGIDHENYRHAIDPLPQPVRDSLAGDLAAWEIGAHSPPRD